MVNKLAMMFVLVCCCVVINAQMLPGLCGRYGGMACPNKRAQPEHAASIDDSPLESMKERNKAARDFLKLKRRFYDIEE